MMQEPGLRFGTAGTPASTKKPSTEAGIRRAKELGLTCLEIAFVHQVKIGEASAAKIRQAGEDEDIRLSIHAPYYINLNAREPDKLAGSRERILKAARAGAMTGARDIALHLAFYHDDEPAAVLKTVKRHLAELTHILREEGVENVNLRPETMGKASQFGTLEEVLELSGDVKGVLPCIDFPHLYARSGGGCNTYDEFTAALLSVRDQLGNAALQNLHLHLSGIVYGPKGERHHLPLEESEFNYRDVLRVLKDVGAGGIVVAESPENERDALLLQRTYQSMTNSK